MFKDLTPKQIDKFGFSFISLAHFSAVALIFGQAATDQPFSIRKVILGVFLLVWLYILAAAVMQYGTRKKRKEEKEKAREKKK